MTLVDRPDVIDIDRQFLEHEPIELVEGDITDELPEGRFGLVFCSRVAHALSPDANRQFLAEAFDALEPGGSVVLTDKVRDRADDAALFGAHMLAQTDAGDTYTEDEFSGWLRTPGSWTWKSGTCRVSTSKSSRDGGRAIEVLSSPRGTYGPRGAVRRHGR
ncbi:class I SAM-dependent methyltransferase [Halorussus caseinilyticus]|uniref:Class I SAM-dependent methyltransferase n=1 Tax=Halorussus caseinilyticus TaxID=3034025 RepID=A0ABD5WMX0_9EURY